MVAYGYAALYPALLPINALILGYSFTYLNSGSLPSIKWE